jgi:signal transduction histidine kinase
VRRAILQCIEEHSAALGFRPTVLFDGPVDTLDEGIAGELLNTLREALSNIARHAHASRAEVELTVGPEVVLLVADNGIGPPEPGAPRGNGLANLEVRAARLGGRFELRAGTPRGSILEWRVPSR